ncbi:MAG: hypothetical protein AB7V46_16385 [Thermomicrobiales bacterium]
MSLKGSLGDILEAEWTDNTGIRRRVVTKRLTTDESDEDFADRHEARIQEQLARYPQ